MTDIETTPYGPNAATPPLEALPQLDSMLDATRLHQLLVAPEVVAERSVAEGYHGDLSVLNNEITDLRSRAINEIALPATVAEMSRIAEAYVSEGANDFLNRAKHTLEQAEGHLVPVKQGLTTIDEQLLAANRAVVRLEEAVFGTGSVTSEQIRTAIHQLETFRLVYEPSVVNVQKPYEVASTDIRVSGHHVSSAAGVAEDSRRHLTLDKTKLEADPGMAYFEGLEEAVDNRGAHTVEEHAQMCGEEYKGRIDKIADLRDDCADLHATLTKMTADLPGSVMAKKLPGSRAIGDAINGLRVVANHAGNNGVSLPNLEPVLYEVKRQLGVIGNNVVGIMEAQPQDTKQIRHAKEALYRVMQAEILQAA